MVDRRLRHAAIAVECDEQEHEGEHATDTGRYQRQGGRRASHDHRRERAPGSALPDQAWLGQRVLCMCEVDGVAVVQVQLVYLGVHGEDEAHPGGVDGDEGAVCHPAPRQRQDIAVLAKGQLPQTVTELVNEFR
jgi:hypothetical protein